MSIHQHQVASRKTVLKIDKLTFTMDASGCLHINVPGDRFPHALTACQTLALQNYMNDCKVETVLQTREEMRAKEKRVKAKRAHKPQMIQVNGQWVEGVELAELEKEQND
jgi:hypothetical protein